MNTMFSSEVYCLRRTELKKIVKEGVVLLIGNNETPVNYTANPYRFRQDSSFLYYFGLDEPNLAGIIDIDNNTEVIYGNDADIEDIIWMGSQEFLQDKCAKVGVESSQPLYKLVADIDKALSQNRKIHYLPPYRAQKKQQISLMLDCNHDEVEKNASIELIKAVVAQRSIKEEQEVNEIEKTMNQVTEKFFNELMCQTKPGKHEFEIVGLIEGLALSNNCTMAYPIICTINGQILHNHHYGNKMNDGQLLLIDAGAESSLHYATDITRTIPVSGKFSEKQKDIYNIVLKAETESIKMIKPGISYQQVHLNASRIISEGLKEMDLMKGNIDDIIENGAHALFFPHGLGHMLGLDVHDMENLGEDYVGYNDQIKRSNQFGTAYLRLGRELQKGFTITVEPGIYFIPALIEKWKSENLYRDFINYDRLFSYIDFGGIRIEDDVFVTENGSKIIGNPVPKTVYEIEQVMDNY